LKDKEKPQKFLVCHCCQKDFPVSYRKFINSKSKAKIFGRKNYCSQECRLAGQNQKPRVLVSCLECQKELWKGASELIKFPNSFCGSSCAATYNNKNKKYGTRRSKLEKFVEENLLKLFPNLEIHYNQKSAIGSELDIYIPSLRTAIEINGIFHFLPIFGQDKFDLIVKNDEEKVLKCDENGIDLFCFDVQSIKRARGQDFNPFLCAILEIIQNKIEFYH
jgi:hypothetical protein